MSRKAQITLALLAILLLSIVTVNALPRVLPSLGLGFNEDNFTFPEEFPIIGWRKEGNSLLVTQCKKGFNWHNVDKLDSNCILPSGEITGGDRITNCEGLITLLHTPSNTVIYTGSFNSIDTQKQPDNPVNPDQPNDENEKDTEENDENPSITNEIPTINIVKPLKDSFYFRNIRIKSSQFVRIIGYIDIEAVIDNPSNIPIKEVKFYIDDTLMYSTSSEPYSWTWNEKEIGDRIIKVIAITESGDEISSEELPITILNLKGK